MTAGLTKQTKSHIGTTENEGGLEVIAWDKEKVLVFISHDENIDDFYSADHFYQCANNHTNRELGDIANNCAITVNNFIENMIESKTSQ